VPIYFYPAKSTVWIKQRNLSNNGKSAFRLICRHIKTLRKLNKYKAVISEAYKVSF